jgi:biotin carboxylase
MDLSNKRLLILGGNPETGALVRHANNLGIHTIVIDPNPNAIAKQFAQEFYDIEVMDVEKLYEKIITLNLDGVLVGVADILVASYFHLCYKLKFPCYATEKAIQVFTSKNDFRNICELNQIDVIPYFKLDEKLKSEDISKIQFPVLTKPVDNGAGVGMKVSYSEKELINNVNFALSHSKRKEFQTEKYMIECDDMLVYYTISDGNIYLSAAADRYTNKSQDVGSPVCISSVYPSKYLNNYLDVVNQRMIELIKSTKILNGVLNIQFFVDINKNFYAYDPGFRLQGEAPHIYLNNINDFDNRSMLINFALTSSTNEPDLNIKNDPFFKGKIATTVWVLLKQGKITKITGLDEIKNDNFIIEIIQRFKVGEIVETEMLGTERQVFARIYCVVNNKTEQNNIYEKIKQILYIENELGENMILDYMDINKL